MSKKRLINKLKKYHQNFMAGLLGLAITLGVVSCETTNKDLKTEPEDNRPKTSNSTKDFLDPKDNDLENNYTIDNNLPSINEDYEENYDEYYGENYDEDYDFDIENNIEESKPNISKETIPTTSSNPSTLIVGKL